MTGNMPPDPPDTQELLFQIRNGNRSAINELLRRHRELLRQFIDVRLDYALRQRLDPSDILQETQLEITRRIDDYLERDPMPFRVWIHRTAYQNLARLRRIHVDVQTRSVYREEPLPASVSILLAGAATGRQVQPLDEILKQETLLRVHSAVSALPELDRDVLLLRAYEGLDNQSAALVLDIDAGTCSKRYARALLKLRTALKDSE